MEAVQVADDLAIAEIGCLKKMWTAGPSTRLHAMPAAASRPYDNVATSRLFSRFGAQFERIRPCKIFPRGVIHDHGNTSK